MNNLPVVSIVGRPNVGKSTLFNRIVGFRQAIVSKTPGTTRDKVFGEVNWDGKDFMLVDTAGLMTDFVADNEKKIEKEAQKQIDEALCESDLILFVVDSKEGLCAQDKEVAKKIRKLGKPIILAVNKADTKIQENEAQQFRLIGFEKVIAVSAITGRRTGDLLDAVTESFPRRKKSVKTNTMPKLAIVGRPNVGKSTLFNALVGSDRSIVSDIPGTTRDSLRFKISLGAKGKIDLEIIDTAGFRRKGRIKQGIERFSVIRTIESIHKSDIVLLVLDGSEGLTRGDAHLAELALENKKELIIAINKLDLVKSEVKELFRFPFITNQVRVAISAKKMQNIELLVREIVKKARRFKQD